MTAQEKKWFSPWPWRPGCPSRPPPSRPRTTPKDQWDGHGLGYFYYFHYDAIQAFYQYGGGHWSDWHPMVRDAILLKQIADGSWDVPARSAEAAHAYPTRVCSTAMACLVLDIHLHFLPAYQR